MAILSKEDAKKILEKVLKFSKADGCEARLAGTHTGNIRYARNSVSTTGTSKSTMLIVQSYFGKKVGTATINEFDDASLEKVIRRAEELAQLAPENPEFVSILGPQTYAESTTFVQSTASITPKQRAELVEQSPKVAKDS